MLSCSQHEQKIVVLESKYELIMDAYKKKCENEKTLEKEIEFYRKHIPILSREIIHCSYYNYYCYYFVYQYLFFSHVLN